MSEVEREPDGWQVVVGNYFPREVVATFRTEAEARAYIEKGRGDSMLGVEPMYFEVN